MTGLIWTVLMTPLFQGLKYSYFIKIITNILYSKSSGVRAQLISAKLDKSNSLKKLGT